MPQPASHPRRPALNKPGASRYLPSQNSLAALAAILIFCADIFLQLPGAVAVLYTAVILLVADGGGRHSVLLSGAICGFLAVLAFLVQHYHAPFGQADIRFLVSLVAIAITTLLAARNRTAQFTLTEQARILELTHDTVIIRGASGLIDYWNDGAEKLYGWRRDEAIGKRYQELLTPEYPLKAVEDALARDGQWSGEMTCLHREGHRIVLATRWLVRMHANGNRIGVIETSSDLTEMRRADAERQRSEGRYRTIFDAAGFAIWESDWSETYGLVQAAMMQAGSDFPGWLAQNPEFIQEAGKVSKIHDINASALKLFEAKDHATLQTMGIMALSMPSAQIGLAGIFAALAKGERKVESDAQFRTLAGNVIDVVLGVTLQPDDENWNRVFIMALDVTDRNRAQAKLTQTVSELAHVSRVTMLGQLAASIAHEVNQPLSAITTYGKSGERWLRREAPDAPEVADCLAHIITNSTRAADVISRIRALAKNSAPQKILIRLDELVTESVSLVQRDVLNNNVLVLQTVEPHLPPVLGDKVQIQQVMVNLIMNALHAMNNVTGQRHLRIAISEDMDMLRVSICDDGSGIPEAEMPRLFEPFVTTKEDGMGMGLSICRSIIEAHGGHISASNNSGQGATFVFTLPAARRAAVVI